MAQWNDNRCQKPVDCRIIEELLESIWTCREHGESSLEKILDATHANVDQSWVQALVERGLVKTDNDSVFLTKSGEDTATGVIRRHRLAERLFVDVLGMSVQDIETAACCFEHGVIPEVTDALCTLLGHPQECPHNKPIPPGNCCKEGRKRIEQAIMPLSVFPCGRSGRIAYIRPLSHDRLHMLLSLGICPGVSIRLHQRTPLLVVALEESEFAMDAHVAKDIYVWIDPKS